jgi:hypothetical protein
MQLATKTHNYVETKEDFIKRQCWITPILLAAVVTPCLTDKGRTAGDSTYVSELHYMRVVARDHVSSLLAL